MQYARLSECKQGFVQGYWGKKETLRDTNLGVNLSCNKKYKTRQEDSSQPGLSDVEADVEEGEGRLLVCPDGRSRKLPGSIVATFTHGALEDSVGETGLGSCRGTYCTRSVRSSVFAVSIRLYCRRHAATSSESTARLWNDNTAALQPVTDWCQTASRAPDTLRKQADSDLLQQPQVSWQQWP